jgi:hypothetical protein
MFIFVCVLRSEFAILNGERSAINLIAEGFDER